MPASRQRTVGVFLSRARERASQVPTVGQRGEISTTDAGDRRGPIPSSNRSARVANYFGWPVWPVRNRRESGDVTGAEALPESSSYFAIFLIDLSATQNTAEGSCTTERTQVVAGSTTRRRKLPPARGMA